VGSILKQSIHYCILEMTRGFSIQVPVINSLKLHESEGVRFTWFGCNNFMPEGLPSQASACSSLMVFYSWTNPLE